MSLIATHSLVDELLADQQNLTAVERFAQRHENATEPIQAKQYRELIPLSTPGVGEQYAFQVDLDACSGCKACVSACHSLNGLDDEESWRDVGTLYGRADGEATQQTVTTACHHCADPACAEGCPTLAYEKDAETGIVRHLDDQCMGCRYCELKCPYEVPKFNVKLGIVRKCDMCHGRLAEGEAPACVQACPNEAIKIQIVKVEEVIASSTGGVTLLPGTVTSDYTKPTTQFLNLNKSVEPAPADAESLQSAHGHFPLVAMLVLTQAGAGIAFVDWLQRLLNVETGIVQLAIGLGLAFAGLGASVLHLGRPTQAWRAFLGWRKSWLSREIIVFGAWSGAYALFFASVLFSAPNWIVLLSGSGAALLGLAGVFTSVMVYADTRRPFWRLKPTLLRFYATALGMGLALSVAPVLAAVPILLTMIFDGRVLQGKIDAYRKSGLLMSGPLKRTLIVRTIAGTSALLASVMFPLVSGGLFLISEIAGRSIFFRAVDEPKMPGGIKS